MYVVRAVISFFVLAIAIYSLCIIAALITGQPAGYYFKWAFAPFVVVYAVWIFGAILAAIIIYILGDD